MLKIGDFSKLSRISIRMLRYYDEIDVLRPAQIDTFTGYRYYKEEQLATACRITELRQMGFGLFVIREIMINYADPAALNDYLKIKRAELLAEEEEVRMRIQLLDSAFERLRKDDNAMNYNVTAKVMPQRYVASVRSILPTYDQEGVLWNTMAAETASLSLQMEEPCMSLAIFHDEDFRDKDVDVEIQVSVKGSYRNTEHVTFKTEPEVVIASAVYKGSYDQITAVNQVVASWVRDNDYEFNGAMFCIYHVSPAQTKNMEELVTEVCYPVRKKS